MKLLSLTESIKLVKKYGVQFAPSRQAGTAEEAARAAEELGFPVALKLISSKISHKTDIGGVALNIENSAGARKAFARMRKLRGFKGVLVQKMVRGKEIIIGGKRDEQFGPTILFGLGGIFVEVFKDYTVRVCPITVRDAREMVQGTGITLRDDWDIRTLVYLMLSTDETLRAKYAHKLEKREQILAEAFRIVGDTDSFDKIKGKYSSISFFDRN